MSNRSQAPVLDFPLSSAKAKEIVNNLASNCTSRIFIGEDARAWMHEHNITNKQIIFAIADPHCIVTEEVHKTACGDWKMNLAGRAAGDLMTIVVKLKRLRKDPSSFAIIVCSAS